MRRRGAPPGYAAGVRRRCAASWFATAFSHGFLCSSETIFLKQFFWLGELLRRGCQGRTQYYELLTCVLVSPTPQVPNNHIDEAVDEEEDMKYKRVQDGAGLITFQISEIVEKFLFFILFGTL